MKLIQRRLVALAMSLIMGMATLPAYANDNFENTDPNKPSEMAMLFDGLVARPLLFGATAVGTVLFIGTLPFSALGGNVKEAGSALVVAPAKATFVRCLGCTPTQDEYRRNQAQ
jgi:hypothetical protein